MKIGKNNYKINKKSGISMVILVVTIIIVLILSAAIIISLSTNNPIKEAYDARKLYNIDSGRSTLSLLYYNKAMEVQKGSLDIEEYTSYLEENGYNTKQEDGKYYAEVYNMIFELVVKDDTIEIEYVEDGTITSPNIQKIDITSITKTEIGIKVSALRMEEGTYYYYIADEKDNLNSVVGSNKTGEFTFTGLTSGKEYYIKVVAESKNGEKDEKIITAKVEALPDATLSNISYKITWSAGKATVTLSTNTKYKIETSLDNSSYSQVSKRDSLSNGDIVYARLTDGLVSGKEMKIIVADTTKPTLNVKAGEVTTKSIEVEAIASDTESGVKEYRYYITDTVDNYSTTPSKTNTTGTALFENLDQNTTYYIKVEVEDNASNVESKIVVIKTELIPNAEENIKREITWQADGSVIVSLSTATKYKIVYSKDGKNYTNYTSSLKENNGTSIYICLTDERNYGLDYKIILEDYVGPTVNVQKVSATQNSIKVKVNANDMTAGMGSSPKYTYYIKYEGEENYTKIAENVLANEYTFTGLNSEKTYNIMVTAKDILGNEGNGKVDVTTEEFKFITGNVTFGKPVWNNKLATVKVTNNTSYNMQYQVIPKGEEINLNNIWNTVEQKEKDVGDLKDEYTIIVRLYDGINVTAGYATCFVEDTNAPAVSVSGNSVDWINSNVTLTVNALDSESGLCENCYSFDGGATWGSSNIKVYEENVTGIVVKVKDEAGNIATSETINITKIDKIGPKLSVEAEAGVNTINVNITEANDTGVGMQDTVTYTYYITSENGKIDEITGETTAEKTKIYSGLTQNTTYYIKVEAQDKLGNVTKEYKTVLTGSLNVTAGDITISDESWENKKASVTLTNKSSYKMEYQVVEQGKTLSDTEWTKTEDKEAKITQLLHGYKVYARLTDDINTSAAVEKEIKDENLPTVTVTGNATEWTKSNVTLTINALDSESGLCENCYSFDGGTTWGSANTKVYEENVNGIVIKVKDEAGNVATSQTINITKIDKKGPEIVLKENLTNTKETTIGVTASDSGCGLEDTITYTYYIKTENDANYTKITDSTKNAYTYGNLKSNVKHIVKVEVKDKLGNIGEKTLEITTQNLLYAVGDITFTNIVWSNGIATVTMNNNVSEYDMEYQISKDGSDIDVNGQWTNVTDKQIDIGSLKDTYIIYARITDGYNSTIGYATCNIDNISKKTYTEEELAKETSRKEYDILGISVSKNEIRLQIDRKIENASLYNYYYKTINDEEYKLISTSSNYDDPAVITDIKEGAIYKVKALVIDNSGNVTRCKNTATTIALDEALVATSYADNRTYIDGSKTINVRTSAGTGSAGTGETKQVNAGYTVSLPATFKISNITGQTKQEDGVVLIDNNENEYVWIPVNDAIYDSVTEQATSTGNAQTRTYRPMAQKQSVDGYYESIVYAYNGVLSYRNSSNTGVGKTSYKEPSLLTNNANDGYTWNISDTTIGQSYDVDNANYSTILNFGSAIEFGRYMANSYTNMITAVDSYGGFYVGRYETTMQTENDTVVVGSKSNQTILSTNSWYKMNLYQDSNRYTSNPYNSIESVTSTMIWGSQWDAMLNYILTGSDASKVTTKTGSQKKLQSNSGQDETDIINNIYDLGSNAYEWTQEASSYAYRVSRGGSYDSSTSGTLASRKATVPTDQGPVFGTRLGLYMQSVNDVTGPSVKINKIESTSNTISLEVTAIDKETGVKGFEYYISKDGGSTYSKIGETDSNKYVYSGLTQNTSYKIKVVAIDGVGNKGIEAIAEKNTTNLGNVANTAIKRTQRYGPNGSGIITLELDKIYTDSGYYIEYQVLESGQTLDVNKSWTKGTELHGLTNGEIIYATIYDGINRSQDVYEEIVAELEEYDYYTVDGKTSKTETVKYTDEDGNVAYIPSGFKVGITDSVKNINDGLVIEDENGNQYVWIPVENAIYDGTSALPTSSSSTITYKPMVRYQNGYSESTEKQYFEGIAYNFASTYKTGSYVKLNGYTLGTSGNREPSIITGSSDYTWNVGYKAAKGTSYDTLENYYRYLSFGATSGINAFNTYTEFGQYMNKEYTNMIKSIDKFGGFYVGRFETSLSGTAGNKNAIPESKITKTPIYNQNWYKSYYYQDSNLNPNNPNYNKTSVASSMIWGSQWDAMINWLLADENTKEFVEKKVGNHTNAVKNTGLYSDDFVKNIFDLSSNVTEWTQEVQSIYREYRGGYCVTTDDVNSKAASGRYSTWRPPTITTIYSQIEGQLAVQKNFLGSRMSMYVKDTADTTNPNIKIDTVESETNNIKVTVNATDNDSGIKKYKYYISYVDFESSEFTEADIISQEETFGNMHVFTDLYQNQSYYIKVEAINNVGLSNVAYTGVVKTNVLEIKEGAIVKEKVYGKDGAGIAYFEISDDTSFEKEGYYIEYQVDSTGAGYNANGTWTKGNTVKNLKVGDVIYLRLYDGKNDSGYYMIVNVTQLETYSETYTSTQKYDDYETVVYEDGTSEEVLVGTAYIPKGFKVATSSITNKIKNGLVIEDEKGNQYVWIPVENAIYDGKTSVPTSSSSTLTYKPMARYQSGITASSENKYYEGVLYYFSAEKSWLMSNSNRVGTMSQREPSLVTNSTANGSWIYTAGNSYDATNYTTLSELGITSAKNMGEYMNNSFTDMVESVDRYGGFYVGRYETSLSGTTVQSQSAKTPMASINWYKMYLYGDSNYASNPYNTSTSVVSSMIWGCQWDTMLTYIQQGSDVEKVTAVTGNHTGTRASTAQFGNDIMNNIFDLSSNVREWTQEADSSTSRVFRGGGYGFDITYPATTRTNGFAPTGASLDRGSRLTLYLK